MFLMFAIPIALFVGFFAGYGVRALLSRMRRARWLKEQGAIAAATVTSRRER
jgi:hypothetical protein